MSDDEPRKSRFRTYRLEKKDAVTKGKWYFEFEIITEGPVKVGWACTDMLPGCHLGDEEKSWAFDGYNVCLFFLFIEIFCLTKLLDLEIV